jgi:hypothetical protein
MARIETNLGDLLAKRGKLQESARLFRASLRGREKILPSNHPDIFDAKQSSAVSWVKKDVFRKRNRSCLTAWHGVDNKASDFSSPSKQRILNEISTCTPHGTRRRLKLEKQSWFRVESDRIAGQVGCSGPARPTWRIRAVSEPIFKLLTSGDHSVPRRDPLGRITVVEVVPESPHRVVGHPSTTFWPNFDSTSTPKFEKAATGCAVIRELARISLLWGL